MGMFDEIVCEYPLPGTAPDFVKPGHHFQTKDLDCVLATYTIDADGVISEPDFTGKLSFYSCNGCIWARGFTFTPDGSDYETVEYLAEFVDSKLTKIQQVEYRRQKALAASVSREVDLLFSNPPQVKRDSTNLVGRKGYVLWGGSDEGYCVEIVYETDKEICWKNEKGKLEVQHKSLYGHILWDSEEEAKSHRRNEVEHHKKVAAELQRLLDAK